MAETAAGRQLTQLHRRQQLAIRASTLADFLTIWPLFNLDDIDGTWPGVEAGLLALIRAGHRRSIDLAGGFYRALRLVEGVPGTVDIRRPPAPPAAVLLATVRILGPISAKKAIAARRPDVAATTLTRLSGSAGRLVLDGGRRTLTETVKADPAAKGYRRVTDGSPCDFCADLARNDITGDRVDFPAHDHCGCAQEPIFGGSPEQFRSMLADLEADVARRSASGESAGIADLVDERGFLITT